jgi:hypothetical protein
MKIYEKIQSDNADHEFLKEEQSHGGFGNQTDSLDKTLQGHRSCEKPFFPPLNGIPFWAL